MTLRPDLRTLNCTVQPEGSDSGESSATMAAVSGSKWPESDGLSGDQDFLSLGFLGLLTREVLFVSLLSSDPNRERDRSRKSR